MHDRFLPSSVGAAAGNEGARSTFSWVEGWVGGLSPPEGLLPPVSYG